MEKVALKDDEKSHLNIDHISYYIILVHSMHIIIKDIDVFQIYRIKMSEFLWKLLRRRIVYFDSISLVYCLSWKKMYRKKNKNGIAPVSRLGQVDEWADRPLRP